MKTIFAYFDYLLTETYLAGWLILIFGVFLFSFSVYGIFWRANNIPDLPVEPTRAMAERRMSCEKSSWDSNRITQIEENLKQEYQVAQRNYNPQIEKCQEHFIYHVSGAFWLAGLFTGIVIVIFSLFFIKIS